jgi:hypothetical protein
MTTEPDATSSPPRCRPIVFIDLAVLTADEPPADRRHEPRRVLAQGAADALALLSESHDVSLVTPVSVEGIAELAALPSVAAAPDDVPAGSWYLTGDEGWCEGNRPTGLRSILVGPRRPPAHRPTLRCDLEARDLNAAVMEILVRETMA